jgi:hypothetical protein
MESFASPWTPTSPGARLAERRMPPTASSPLPSETAFRGGAPPNPFGARSRNASRWSRCDPPEPRAALRGFSRSSRARHLPSPQRSYFGSQTSRKAAAYIYKRRLHVITLFVYRADGLPWSPVPPISSVSLGHVRARELTTGGFHVIMWRDGDLGYALVSDLDPRELETLGTKIVGG